MSKVEKNATVEVKVVKVEDEGGEFHTQVGTHNGTEIVDSQKYFSLCAHEARSFRVGRKRSSKGEGAGIILLGIKSMRRTEEGL